MVFRMPTVGILGAGTMGAGIAQIAAVAGWTVRLTDIDPAFVARQIAGIAAQLAKLVEKGKITAQSRESTLSNLHACTDVAQLADCELLIEAVVEDLDAKVRIVGEAVRAAPRAIIASNTSSLSITKIGQGIDRAPATVGMHFFNPVPLMPLVEIIAGDAALPANVRRAAEIATSWGKTVVHAKDTPGFIVNRVARGYYLESLRMLDEGVAGIDEIDRTLKSLGGFRMGPFELMDLIGIDVNYSVSCSVWEQMGRTARLTPHDIQRRLAENKQLGRKTKRGFYSYEPGDATPLPAILVDRKSFEIPPGLYKAVRRVNEGATETSGSITEQYVFARVLAAIINEAAFALDQGVSTAEDIDTAMRLGTNYPKGPLEWVEKIGRHTVASLLRELNERTTDNRFAPAEYLSA